MQSTIAVIIIAAWLMAACRPESAFPDMRSAPVTPVRQPAAAADRTLEAMRIPVARRLPVMPEDALHYGQRGRVDMTATASDSGKSGFWLVYDSAVDGEMSAMHLRQARSMDGVSIGPASELPITQLAIAGSPSLVRVAGRTWLYLIASDTFDQDPQFLRIDVTDPARQVKQALSVARFMRLWSWPRVVADGRGQVALAFRDRDGRPCVAYSRDGVLFDTPRRVDEGKSAMVGIGPMTGGGWLLSYQQTDEHDDSRMKTIYRVSADGKEWSAPVRAAGADLDVHDAFSLPRIDRGADLYYVHRPDATSISLYRRAIFADATQGPEQQLTAGARSEALKPTAHRLRDGRILVTYAAVTARDNIEGYPSEQQLMLFRLEHDAPIEASKH